jgi:flagellar protein FlaF
MGFSVSGSAAIIFAAMFVAFGMFHSATANGFERVTEAQEDRTDRELTRQNTAITISSAEWNTTGQYLIVSVKNTGATALDVEDVDLLADNTYINGPDTSVEGDSSTTVWAPQDTLEINATSPSSDPGQIKIVTGPGVADTHATTTVS